MPRKFKAGPSIVRQGMQEIAGSDKNVDIVKTTTVKSWLDYTKHSDNLHQNIEEQIRLRVARADKLIALREPR